MLPNSRRRPAATSNRTRLLRIASVILDVEHELLAKQPARSIEVGDSVVAEETRFRATSFERTPSSIAY